MLDDLDRRGSAVFGSTRGEVNWPYDTPSFIDFRLRRTDRAAYDREVAEARAKQEAIVSWAEHHDLKASSISCCLLWLVRPGRSRRCRDMNTCHSGPASRSWFDHPIFWLKDGLPAVVTSVAYGPAGQGQAEINWWTNGHGFKSERGPGWYGSHSSQVLIWRPDRIRRVQPAWLEERS